VRGREKWRHLSIGQFFDRLSYAEYFESSTKDRTPFLVKPDAKKPSTISCEDRYQVRSTILTSQLPVSRWHEQIGDPTLADGILDRLVHNAHRIEMRGDSMRKNRHTSVGITFLEPADAHLPCNLYLCVGGGTMPFIRRYSTSWP